MKWTEYLIIPLLLVTVLSIVLLHNWINPPSPGTPGVEPESFVTTDKPDFKSYTNVKLKKRDFVAFMLPRIRHANDQVLVERKFVQELANKNTTTTSDEEKLAQLYKKYRVKSSSGSAEKLNLLLKKIDIVPASLILAQSANESAWGTSRFATEANNFFGIWCFKKGCGLTPRARDEGLIHEVAKFSDVQDGINHYIRTINSHPAYKTLRSIRAKLHQENQPLSGIEMAEGLLQYSERGQAYVHEIQSMISYNKFHQFNRQSDIDQSSAE